MKSQIDLHQAVLADQLSLHGLSTSQDLATLRSRVEHEGERILTLDLPRFGADFEKGLSQGFIDQSMFFGFSRRSKTDRRPSFLNGLLSKVFDRDGSLLSDIDPTVVRSVRQISYLHSKLKELPTDDKVDAAIRKYVETDENISNAIPFELREEFKKTARRMWGTHFARMERILFEDPFLPAAKHGPGAVAQKLTSNGKWASRAWTHRLDAVFPAYLHLSHIGTSDMDNVELHPPASEPPSRVICVPKTAKGPRVITAEPVYNQFVQQGLSALFESWMDVHPCVSYVSQKPNQDLARAGSIDGSYATIDLSEASDRVSLALVKLLLRDHPFLLTAVLACRTQRSELPDGTIVLLRKFASMGSALCFPIETLVFATIAMMANWRIAHSRQVDEVNLRVYGDDIIVRADAANETVSLLEAFGLKVNTDKSFLSGNFRESCGGDFFEGTPVNPVRTRKRLPQSRSDVDEVVAIVAFRNLYAEMYGETEVVTILDSYIADLIPFPYGPRDSPYLVRWSESWTPDGIHGSLQQPYVNAVRPVYQYRDDPLDGYGALRKFFWTPFQETKDHLEHAGRPVSARLKYGQALRF